MLGSTNLNKEYDWVTEFHSSTSSSARETDTSNNRQEVTHVESGLCYEQNQFSVIPCFCVLKH